MRPWSSSPGRPCVTGPSWWAGCPDAGSWPERATRRAPTGRVQPCRCTRRFGCATTGRSWSSPGRCCIKPFPGGSSRSSPSARVWWSSSRWTRASPSPRDWRMPRPPAGGRRTSSARWRRPLSCPAPSAWRAPSWTRRWPVTSPSPTGSSWWRTGWAPSAHAPWATYGGLAGSLRPNSPTLAFTRSSSSWTWTPPT